FCRARTHPEIRVRVSDALRRAPRLASATRARRLQHARLCALWEDLVSILHAPSGGAPRQRLVRVEEHAQRLTTRDARCAARTAARSMRRGERLMESYVWIIWVVLGVILLVAEIFTTGFVMLWFGI